MNDVLHGTREPFGYSLHHNISPRRPVWDGGRTIPSLVSVAAPRHTHKPSRFLLGLRRPWWNCLHRGLQEITHEIVGRKKLNVLVYLYSSENGNSYASTTDSTQSLRRCILYGQVSERELFIMKHRCNQIVIQQFLLLTLRLHTITMLKLNQVKGG